MHLFQLLRLSSIHRSCAVRSVRQMSSRFDYSGLNQEAKEDHQAFLNTYPKFKNEIISVIKENPCIESVFLPHFNEFLDYTCPYGKKLRPVAVATSYREFQNQTKEQIAICNMLAWCVESIQVQALIIDDILDNGQMRHGKTCWHKKDGIDMLAIADCYVITFAAYELIKKHFSQKPYYNKLVEILNKNMITLYIGQTNDTMIAVNYGERTLKHFTMDNFLAVAEYKTTSSILAAFEIALVANGITDPIAYKQLKDVITMVGQLYQIQNDGLDIFANLQHTGKLGTDIPNGTCTWMIVMAMQLGNAKQIQILEENFGKDIPECVQRVKDVYLELQLPKLYSEQSRQLYKKMVDYMEDPSFKVPKNMIYRLVHKFYRDVPV